MYKTVPKAVVLNLLNAKTLYHSPSCCSVSPTINLFFCYLKIANLLLL